MTESDYLDNQRKFWSTGDLQCGRVDVESRTPHEYEAAADRDFDRVFWRLPDNRKLLSAGIYTPVVDSPQEAWRPAKPKTILEIGCGVGRLLQLVQKRLVFAGVDTLMGVDISPAMIEAARDTCEANGWSWVLFLSNGKRIPVESESVNFAYSNDVFIHIADRRVVESYLSEAVRVLKPGGIFRFNVRSAGRTMFSKSIGGTFAWACYRLGLRSFMREVEASDDGFSGLFYRERDVRRLLKRAGFSWFNVDATLVPGRLWITAGRK